MLKRGKFAKEVENAEKPRHYTRFAIQPLTFALANGLEAYVYEILSYLMRDKENKLQDHLKAKAWLDCKIHQLETGEVLPPNELYLAEKLNVLSKVECFLQEGCGSSKAALTYRSDFARLRKAVQDGLSDF